jgi:hypothetical protein
MVDIAQGYAREGLSVRCLACLCGKKRGVRVPLLRATLGEAPPWDVLSCPFRQTTPIDTESAMAWHIVEPRRIRRETGGGRQAPLSAHTLAQRAFLSRAAGGCVSDWRRHAGPQGQG